MIVMDSFALPVEGTETRVNAQAQAYEYMTAYIEAAKQVTYVCSIFSKYHTCKSVLVFICFHAKSTGLIMAPPEICYKNTRLSCNAKS